MMMSKHVTIWEGHFARILVKKQRIDMNMSDAALFQATLYCAELQKRPLERKNIVQMLKTGVAKAVTTE